MSDPDRLPLALDVALSVAMPWVTVVGVFGAWRITALLFVWLGR